MNVNVHKDIETYAHKHKQRDILSNLNPIYTDAVHNLHVVFVSSTLLLPVCFFNLTVYISGSKPVSITPTRAISMREKQIKCLMKANPGS